MSALTSLLVRDRIVPVSKIEEALQSQVFLGGDLELILLEMNLVPEDVLSAYRAALFDLLPATREEVMRASREALKRVPPELARAVGMVPLLFEKHTLVVAAWEPIYEPRLGEIEAQLGCELSVRIVNGARLAAGLAHHYGFELDVRLRRLSEALRRRDPGVVPYVRPPTPSMLPPRPSLHEVEPDSEPPAIDGEPLPAAEQEDAYVDLEAERATIPPGVSLDLAHLLRPPLSLDAATGLLREVALRDDALFVLLRYLQQFFRFVCVFSVTREGIRARMMHGAPLDPELVQHVAITAPRAGLLAQAVRERRPLLGCFGDAPEEHDAAVLLERGEGELGLVVPVVLSGRVVLLVYVDGAADGITLAHAELVEALVPAVSDALYRLILEQKQQRSSLHPPAPAEAGAEPHEEHARPLDTQAPAESGEREVEVLRPVDLDALEQASDAATAADDGRTHEAAREESPEAARLRERLPGIPRAAPPPPAYHASSSTRSAQITYSRGGLAEERVVVQVASSVALTEPAPRAEPPAPERRLSLVEEADEPTVIIDMGESVDALIAALQGASQHDEPPEIDELLELGEGVLPVLTQHFPGPLWFDRAMPHKHLPASRDVSAVARAMLAFGERAAPYLGPLIGASDPDRCFYALLLARDIVHPDLLDPIARHILDPDPELRALALAVLRGYAGMPQYEVVLHAISDLSTRAGNDAERQRMAVEALAALRDGRSLPALIARLRDPDDKVVLAAHEGLVVLTGQDFGLSTRRWESWAEGWGRAHRVEWLIESLLHSDEGVRTLAGDELKQVTQQYFGFHPALPRRDRELAQRKYREWWELEGRIAFGR